jgi:transcriptional regulator with XRE-family HTH domain
LFQLILASPTLCLYNRADKVRDYRRLMDQLAELRERRALTLRELAEMSGVAADTINQIELGHRKPRPSTLRKLARALEVDVQEFMPPKAKAPSTPGQPEEIHFEDVDEAKFWMSENLQDAAYQGMRLELEIHKDGSADIRIMPAGSPAVRKTREKRVARWKQ